MKPFSKVLGYANIKAELSRIVDLLKNPEKYENLGVESPCAGILLLGECGTGKTLLANEMIRATGCKSYVVRKEQADGSFVDTLRETFDIAVKDAKDKYVIILLDDLHSYSNEDSKHCYSDEFVVLQSKIDQYRNQKIFVLATANSTDSMPNSLLRSGRLKVIEVKPPKGEDAKLIIKHYLNNKKSVSPDVDTDEIAKILDGRSCACLEEICQTAGLISGYQNKSMIDMDDIIKACLRILYSSPEDVTEDENPYLYNIAIHEAGHTVASLLIEKGVNLVTVARHDSDIEGITSTDRDPYYFQNIDAMKARIVTLLSGRAAVELIFGSVDPGANSDIHRAMRIVSRLVDNFCEMGFDAFEGECTESSDELLNRKEQRIFTETEKYYQQAKKLMIDNRQLLENIAKELLDKKVLLKRDLTRIQDETAKQAACGVRR